MANGDRNSARKARVPRCIIDGCAEPKSKSSDWCVEHLAERRAAGLKRCSGCGQDFLQGKSNRTRCNPCSREKWRLDARRKLGIEMSPDETWQLPVGTVRGPNSAGYMRIKVAEPNVWRPEHIAIMEAELGRPLLPLESVHHKNNIKHDNRRENLELWTGGQPTGARVADLVVWARELLELYGKDF